MRLVINISEYDKDWIQNAYGIPQEINVDIAKAIINGEPHKPNRKKGKWIVAPDGRLHCSVCSEIPTNRIIAGGYLIYDIAPIRKYMKFCPTCGSYNGGDGEQDEIDRC